MYNSKREWPVASRQLPENAAAKMWADDLSLTSPRRGKHPPQWMPQPAELLIQDKAAVARESRAFFVWSPPRPLTPSPCHLVRRRARAARGARAVREALGLAAGLLLGLQ